jgi:hypothetical protein
MDGDRVIKFNLNMGCAYSCGGTVIELYHYD